MKGSYCLIINLKKNTKIKIGKRLGFINFKKGTYVYVGSAMNCLESRVKRHLSNNKKKHWHVDYLLLNENSKIEKVYTKESSEKLECKIAKKIIKNQESIANFGCSDCKCQSHLIYFKNSKLANRKVSSVLNSFD
ncbi:DUF123 domain-containing protein [uncultured Methanobrevibacter sp.]|uniref:GIY-YIG nuclease family protein n=1 Tax=uncultured Methanobrevibacter sp. TaxID=253161 RepID=UPI0026073C9F|nr:GIY-YIG nuclease family protein [uncultured Methanobrevibacter sp.]